MKGLKAQKSKGQNFLIDKNVLGLMLKCMSPCKDEFILEIGPGFGILTEKLLEAGAFVCAIELDRKLCRYLEKNINDKKISINFG